LNDVPADQFLEIKEPEVKDSEKQEPEKKNP
jgi:hypothetical protein